MRSEAGKLSRGTNTPSLKFRAMHAINIKKNKKRAPEKRIISEEQTEPDPYNVWFTEFNRQTKDETSTAVFVIFRTKNPVFCAKIRVLRPVLSCFERPV
jgi:hypothetical protein